jgi:RecA/RadA recombinase
MRKKDYMSLSIPPALKKKYGSVFITAADVFEDNKDKKMLRTVPILDQALEGGIKEGSTTLISGDPKTCKTSICLHLCKNAIDDGRPVAYFDVENRLRNKQLDGIHKLQEYRDKIFMPYPDGLDVWPAEKWLDIAEMLMKDPANRGMLLVIDSASALITKSEMEEEVSGQLRAGLPKTMSHWTKKLARAIPGNDIILVLVRHFIADTGRGPKTKGADGGRKIVYAADTILNVKYTKKWNESEVQIGHQIIWDIETSTDGDSHIASESWLRYGQGIDIVHEYVQMAKSINLVKGSTWMTLSYLENFLQETGDKEWDESKYKFNGMKQLKRFFDDSPLHFALLKKEIDELLLGQ